MPNLFRERGDPRLTKPGSIATMPIHKHKKSPYYQYEFQWNGRRFRGTTGETSKRRAQIVEEQEKLKAKTGSNKPQATLDCAAESYWQHRGQLAVRAKADEQRLLRLIQALGPQKLISEVSEPDLLDSIQKRRKEGSLRGKGRAHLSNATINRTTVQLFKRVHTHARVRMKVEVSEIDWRAVILREADPRSRELTAGEERSLFEHLRTDLHPITRFALATGLRKEDAIRVKRGDVDFDARQLHARIKSPKPGRKPHRIWLTDELVQILQHEMSLHKFEQVFSAVPHDTHGRPKRNCARRPLTVSALRCQWYKALAAAKIMDFRWHDLRHTAGSRCARVAGLNVTKDLLGHESIATTARYAHTASEDMITAMNAMSLAAKSDSRNTPGADDQK
tara:strand:+ start:8167 stop:9342 length:1176 start_codon:yes stop_codon:yes gene_type:complete